LLAQHFLEAHCRRYGRRIKGFTPEATALLERFEWPGNVRELSNEVERLVVLMEDDSLVTPADLSPYIRELETSEHELASTAEGVLIPYRLGYDEAVTTLERKLVERALRRAGGVVSRAAAELRMERTRLTKLGRRLAVIND
jgi:DNA-binding NtrC family response regulator